MDILLVTEANYAAITRVLLFSICENHKDKQIDFWLVYHNLSEEMIQEIQNVMSLFNKKKLHPIYIDDSQLEAFQSHSEIPAEAFYQFLAIDLLPSRIQTILYLDSNTIVKGDLSEIFETDLQGHPFAVCEDVAAQITGCDVKSGIGVPSDKKYFNANILYMNLSFLREHKVGGFLINRIMNEYHNYPYRNQDILNHSYMDDVIYLPWFRFNLTPILAFAKRDTVDSKDVTYATYSEFNNRDEHFDETYIELTHQYIKESSIIHYTNDSKPWTHRNQSLYWIFEPYKNFWLDYERKLQIQTYYNLEEISDSISFEPNEYLLQIVQNEIFLKEGASILELNCGIGNTLHGLINIRPDLNCYGFGTDDSVKLIGAKSKRAQIIYNDRLNEDVLRFEHTPFDLVILNINIGDTTSIDTYLDIIQTVTESDSRIIIALENTRYYKNWLSIVTNSKAITDLNVGICSTEMLSAALQNHHINQAKWFWEDDEPSDSTEKELVDKMSELILNGRREFNQRCFYIIGERRG